jgi:hypothetical protein
MCVKHYLIFFDDRSLFTIAGNEAQWQIDIQAKIFLNDAELMKTAHKVKCPNPTLNYYFLNMFTGNFQKFQNLYIGNFGTIKKTSNI